MVECFGSNSCYDNFVKLNHSTQIGQNQTVLCLGEACYAATHFVNDY